MPHVILKSHCNTGEVIAAAGNETHIFVFENESAAEPVVRWLNSPAYDYGAWKYGAEWGWCLYDRDSEELQATYPDALLCEPPKEYLAEIVESLKPDKQKEALGIEEGDTGWGHLIVGDDNPHAGEPFFYGEEELKDLEEEPLAGEDFMRELESM